MYNFLFSFLTGKTYGRPLPLLMRSRKKYTVMTRGAPDELKAGLEIGIMFVLFRI